MSSLHPAGCRDLLHLKFSPKDWTIYPTSSDLLMVNLALWQKNMDSTKIDTKRLDDLG
jgi:hypothetical protein